jgi:hypothetical protein
MVLKTPALKTCLGMFLGDRHKNKDGACVKLGAVLCNAGSWHWLQDTEGQCVTGYFHVRLGEDAISVFVASLSTRLRPC